jgi:outer membrane receptor protein involved in Fe transport
MSLKRNKQQRASARVRSVGANARFSGLPEPLAVARGMRVGGAGMNTLAAAVAGILYCAGGANYAQAQAAAEPASTESALEEVVVTASATGVRKLDASFSIISANLEQIKMSNPQATADILKLSPGIWPESSGGQTGANIEIAGLPGGGDSPYFSNMLEGSPIYGMPSLSFMDSSSLFRLDDTIQRVEIVQFGPGAIYGPGQLGATANFILKRGTDTPTGSLGITYGSEHLYRVDAFVGGPIAPGWYGSAGGFYRASDGIRDPQFKADLGGQFTATVSHDLDGGSLMFYFRALDDKNQFITPVPVIENGLNGSFSQYPGFNALTSTYQSNAMRHVNVPSAAGGFQNADLDNGRGGTLYYLGSKYDKKIGTWTFTNSFLFNGGDLNTNALFSGNNPRPLSYYLYGCQVPQPAGFCNGTTAVDSHNYGVGSNGLPTLTGGNGQGIPLSTNVSAHTVGGGTVAPGQSVIQQGWWFIQKHLTNITDEFRVSKEIFDGNTLTAGVYLANYTDDDNWSFGNQMLMTNTPNAQPIVLNYTNGLGQTVNLSSPQGFVDMNSNFNILEHGSAQNTAFYLTDSWKWNGFLFDVGARIENIDAHQRTCNRSNQQLGTSLDLYDNAVPICNGTWDNEHFDHTKSSFTTGVNYEILDNMSVYARFNTGVHFNDFDNGIRSSGPLTATVNTSTGITAPIQTVKNIEFGFKFQNSFAYLDINAYHRQFLGLPYQQTNDTGVGFGPITAYGSDAKGINFNATVTPIHNLNVNVVGDYMDGHYTHYNGCAPYTDINGNAQCSNIDGQPLQRQPKFQIRVTPSYTVEPLWGAVTGWVTYEHVGQRYEDITGLGALGSYYMLEAGLLFNYGNNWELRLQGTNLTNQIAITEGNARRIGQAAGVDNVLLARPYPGREGNIGVKYKF